MKVTTEKNEQVANLKFATIYDCYVTKVEKKGRTIAELNQVIEWLTGYNEQNLKKLIKDEVTFRTFFQKANLHPNAHMIKGVICGYRIEDISDKFAVYKQCRYLDKLVDELAKGRKMEKILRVEKVGAKTKI